MRMAELCYVTLAFAVSLIAGQRMAIAGDELPGVTVFGPHGRAAYHMVADRVIKEVTFAGCRVRWHPTEKDSYYPIADQASNVVTVIDFPCLPGIGPITIADAEGKELLRSIRTVSWALLKPSDAVMVFMNWSDLRSLGGPIDLRMQVRYEGKILRQQVFIYPRDKQSFFVTVRTRDVAEARFTLELAQMADDTAAPLGEIRFDGSRKTAFQVTGEGISDMGNPSADN